MYVCKNCGYTHNGNVMPDYNCPICQSKNYIPEDEYVIQKVSNNPDFLKAMRELKEKDIIEYELKMSQFRNQIEQKSSNTSNIQSTHKQSNQPTCPFCKSSNVKKISGSSKAVSVALWGLFSQKVKKQWHCNNCGSDF